MKFSLSPAEQSPRPGLPEASPRLAALDGWRAISICLVLATHLLPLGPKSLQLNEMTGPMGMALFFTLSGFHFENKGISLGQRVNAWLRHRRGSHV